MLDKINYIKHLGLVFEDFAWPASVPSFKKVNFIYGWNGCGKTTFSRIFDIAASGASTSTEYEFQLQDGSTAVNGQRTSVPIRVFNKDYVDANVRILESKASTISVLLGEDNKGLLAQIEADTLDLNGDPNNSKKGKIAELSALTEKKKRKEKDNDTAFTDTAKTISAAITGSTSATRTYRSPDAKRDFGAIATENLLSDDALKAEILSLRQQPLSELESIQEPSLSAAFGTKKLSEVLSSSCEEAKTLLTTTVEAKVIDHLASHPEIATWVEAGIQIHAEHGSERCEYCGNPISPERITQLAQHFSDADRELKQKLDHLLSNIRRGRSALSELRIPDAARLYEELQATYSLDTNVFTAARDELIAHLDSLENEITNKKLKTTESIELVSSIDCAHFLESLSKLNEAIQTHNKKSREFQEVQRKAVSAIKTHYLSQIRAEVIDRIAVIDDLVIELARRGQEIKAIQARIESNRALISSNHRACEDINNGLRTFLGRDELRFEPDQSTDGKTVTGYQILRGNDPAISLSEGEKTAIAFVYFVVHLNDGRFHKATGLVVIDDPISSLDSNSLYQAFSFLKNAVLDCAQTIVLTHNFDFLKLLLNWRVRQKKDTGYYMLNNEIVGTARRAVIQEMDPELRDYESEYHYLFKRLKQMQADQDGSIMRAYPVPNIARKVWETFLMFRVPNSESPYNKMETLKQQGYDRLKLDAIYKFTNDQSHMTGAGFNPALVPETKKVLAEILEMMQVVAPDHFAILDKATS